MVRERSRSRDDPPMWGHPNSDRPHDPTHHRRWNYTPALCQTRRVLILVNLDATKQLMSEQMSDIMDVTTCEHLPDLRPPEELALFTYTCLLTPGQIQITSVGDLLNYISLYIHNTLDVHIDAEAWIFDGVIVLCSPASPNHHSLASRTPSSLDGSSVDSDLQLIG